MLSAVSVCVLYLAFKRDSVFSGLPATESTFIAVSSIGKLCYNVDPLSPVSYALALLLGLCGSGTVCTTVLEVVTCAGFWNKPPAYRAHSGLSLAVHALSFCR